MRLLIPICLTALCSYAALFLTPWWASMVVALVVSVFIRMSAGRSFIAGAIGVAVCWLIAAFMIDLSNEHLLSSRMAVLFQLPSYAFMLILTTAVGFISGGLGAWTGACLRQLFLSNKRPTATTGVSE